MESSLVIRKLTPQIPSKSGEKRDDGTILAEDGTAFKHTPAESLTQKKKSEKLRQKLDERKKKRDIDSRLKKVKGLGESDSDGDDTSKWIERSRKIEKKKVRPFFLEEMLKFEILRQDKRQKNCCGETGRKLRMHREFLKKRDARLRTEV